MLSALRYFFVFRVVRSDPNDDPLLQLRPLQGVLPTLPPLLRVVASLLGFPCRSAHSFRRSPHSPEFHLRIRSVPRDSHPLYGLLLLRPCRFVSPRKRPSAFPSGISPLKEPYQLFTGRCRLAVAPSVALPPPRFGRSAGACWALSREGARCLWPTSRLCSP